MFRVSWLSFFVGMVVVTSQAYGEDEPEFEVDKQWAAAKEQYEKDCDALHQTVIDHFTAFETKAREKGDLQKLKELQTERLAFDEKGGPSKVF